jgi:4-diphosphocytidyl-2-C-methyl-D-erythritol kinase
VIAAALAPAKVNLFLHVAPLQPDGFHPLASLMTFADVGDRLELHAGETSGLDLAGPFAGALAGEDPAKNLAWRAVEALLARTGVSPPSFRLKLSKALPVAAGLGGGSSDAGAALRLVRDAFAPKADDALLEAIAGELGSDGPACLHARPVMAQGRGERLSAAPPLPTLDAVLVNPRVACPTGRVYRAYDDAPDGAADLPESLETPASFDAAIHWLSACRNDLERPALTVTPQIGDVLALLRSAPETALARLSGSGATCFALCRDAAASAALARRVEAAQPGWWVATCRFGGAPREDGPAGAFTTL